MHGSTEIGQLMKTTTELYLTICVCLLISSQFIMSYIEKSSLQEVEPVRVYYSNSIHGTQELGIYSEKGNVKYEEFSKKNTLFNSKYVTEERSINLLNYQLPTNRQARFTYVPDEPK